MEGTNYSLADIAAMNKNDGFLGGGSGTLIILFLIIMMMGNGGIFGNRNGELNQYATAASQQQILFNQQFDALGQKVNQIGDGICSSTYALNNAITGEGRNIQMQLAECCCSNQRNVDALRFDMSNYTAATQAAIHAEGEATRNMLQQNKIESLQGQINQLQLQAAMCGVVRYPNSTTYCGGASPFCGCNNNI